MHGTTVMIGAHGRNVGSVSSAGAVDVYTITDTGDPDMPYELTYVQTLTAESDAHADDRFGNSIGISDDAVVIGAPLHDEQGEDAGAAYVFTSSGGSYSYAATLLPEEDSAGAFYGLDVDAYDNLIVVGALGHDAYTGAAYLYEGAGSSWPLVRMFTARDGEPGDRFGNAVALEDGVLMVGSPYDDDDDLGEDAGSVYPFEKTYFDVEPITPELWAVLTAGRDFGPSFLTGGKAKTGGDDWGAAVWEELDGVWSYDLLPDLLGGGSQVNALATVQDEEIYAGGTALDMEGNWQPIVWSRADGQWALTVLPKPMDAVSGEVLSLNEDSMGRLIATGSAGMSEGLQIAPMWTRMPGEEWIVGVLPPLVPGQDTVACDFIESNGPIVIGHARDAFDGLRAVIWDRDGPIWQIAPLPNLPGGVQSAAFGGTSGATPIIAGWSETAAGNRQAVSWMLEDDMWRPLALGAPGCFLNSQAIACAWPDDWEMPWLSGFAASGPDTAEAMLWLGQGPDAEAINLNDFVEDEWIIRRATSISQSGRITAWGVQPGRDDEPRAFILTVSRGSSCVGDLDGDGDVDISDLALLLAAYGTCIGDPDYNPAADLDGSGCVDLPDLAILLSHYGEISP